MKGIVDSSWPTKRRKQKINKTFVPVGNSKLPPEKKLIEAENFPPGTVACGMINLSARVQVFLLP